MIKWEKKELFSELKRVKRDLEKAKSEYEKVKLNIEKFENSSKQIESLIKAQIHDKLKPGLGYTEVPPPYNNNYIPPTKEVVLNNKDGEIPVEATKVDPSKTSSSKEEKVNDEISNEKQTNIIKENSTKEKSVEQTRIYIGKKKVHLMNSIFKKYQWRYQSNCMVNESNKQVPHINQIAKGNQRNWIQKMTQEHELNFKSLKQKSCFICGKTNHIAKYYFHNPIRRKSSGYENKKDVFKKTAYRKFHPTSTAQKTVNAALSKTPKCIKHMNPKKAPSLANESSKTFVKPKTSSSAKIWIAK